MPDDFLQATILIAGLWSKGSCPSGSWIDAVGRRGAAYRRTVRVGYQYKANIMGSVYAAQSAINLTRTVVQTVATKQMRRMERWKTAGEEKQFGICCAKQYLWGSPGVGEEGWKPMQFDTYEEVASVAES